MAKRAPRQPTRNKGLIKVKVRDLAVHDSNFRVHTDAQRNALKAVVGQLGWYGYPDVFKNEAGQLQLIDGHLRREYLLEQFGENAEVEVNLTDMSPEEAKLALATHDPLSAMAETDSGILSGLLSDIEGYGDLDGLLLQMHNMGGVEVPPPVQTVVEDDAPEPPKNPITKPGDLWVLGKHRLLCGSSTLEKDVARLCKGVTPFLLVTDPPYGVDYDPEWRDEAARHGFVHGASKRTGKVQNDSRVDWTEAYKLFKGDVAYVWHAGKYAGQVAQHLEATGLEIRSQLIWQKVRLVVGRGHYHWKHEPCWYAFRKGAKGAKWMGGRKQSTVWEITGREDNETSTNHGTQKPVECMARPIRNHGGPEDVVLDMFMGSGSTVSACEQLGRVCLGMEIDPGYCDVIVDRWQTLSGKKAKLAAS